MRETTGASNATSLSHTDIAPAYCLTVYFLPSILIWFGSKQEWYRVR